LTDEEVEIQFADSFRTGRQFIKSAADPITENAIHAYVKTLPLCKECKEYFKEAEQVERPPCGVCFHFYKEPKTYTDKEGNVHTIYGWIKLRGQFPTNGTAENEIRSLMQEHDTYTKTELMPKGVFWPLTSTVIHSEERMEEMYNEDVKRQDDIKQAMIEFERKKEEALVNMQKESEPGSLEDYVKQKVRLCTAEVKLQKAKEIIKTFTPILEKVEGVVGAMEDEHENYYDDGLVLYQEKMEEIGYPKPTSYYDNIAPGI